MEAQFRAVRRIFALALILLLCGTAGFAFQENSIPKSELIQPEDLVKVLQSSTGEKPLIIQVGFRNLYDQAHIPGAEHFGPAGGEDGMQSFRERVASLPRDKFIVIYCGCCPWIDCPNVEAAARTLRGMDFKNFEALYIAHNFGTDWVDKGYPTAKGK
jgi:thiosulfate/3-mercaptopyruvate sulfurtransferase